MSRLCEPASSCDPPMSLPQLWGLQGSELGDLLLRSQRDACGEIVDGLLEARRS